MGVLWVVLLLALTGTQWPLGSQGHPLKSTPPTYPHDGAHSLGPFGVHHPGLYGMAALAIMLTAAGLFLGCAWCYRHKDCKQTNEGTDNQLFTASVNHLHQNRANPPDSGFSEPANNNISEDNNNGPISLREMQNIANNNAAVYIVSENEERNRGRESVVEFEPLPVAIGGPDPLENCADWFAEVNFPRDRLQYLRQFATGWFGRVVEGEIDEEGVVTNVAIKILNQNAPAQFKARFLDEARVFRDVRHDNILGFIGKCIEVDPWILVFELCPTDLKQYLVRNRGNMSTLSAVPLQLMRDVTSAISHLHARGHYLAVGPLHSENVLVRSSGENIQAVVGSYSPSGHVHEFLPPEARQHPPLQTASTEIWSLGTLLWEICSWGEPVPPQDPPPPPQNCVYRNHLYQVMQLCWNHDPESRPTASQVHALIQHLASTRPEPPDFEERWQTLKPNTIPKQDEHVAIVHAPSTSMASHFTGSEQDIPTTQDTLSIDIDTAVSRSSSIMSDRDPLSVQIKSESLTNLHGSLEDVRNIYLTHNETAALECHQGNTAFEEKDHSDSSVDPWLKDIIAGSQDDVSYYRDVSDVIKNLDNILNSEKTSSSESSHQASPSRENLSLDCKTEYPIQSSMVKSPGISNFQNVLEIGFDDSKGELFDEDDPDTAGILSHSFERHSDTLSEQTLENLTPDTPIKDDIIDYIENKMESVQEKNLNVEDNLEYNQVKSQEELSKEKLENSDSVPKIQLSVDKYSVSENEQSNVNEDCKTPCDNNLNEIFRTDVEAKSVVYTPVENADEKITVDKKATETYNKHSPQSHHGLKGLDMVLTKDKDLSEDKKETKFASPIIENGNKITENVTLSVIDNVDVSKNDIENFIEVVSEPQTVMGKIDVYSSAVLESLSMTRVPQDNIIYNSEKVSNDHVPEKNKISISNGSENAVIKNCDDLLIEQQSDNKIKVIDVVKTSEQELKIIDLEKQNKSPLPEPVQNTLTDTPITQTEKAEQDETKTEEFVSQVLPDIVQNSHQEQIKVSEIKAETSTDRTKVEVPSISEVKVGSLNEDTIRSDNTSETGMSNDSTVYMDLINNTNSQVIKDKILDNNIDSSNFLDGLSVTTAEFVMNESTTYLDLPSDMNEINNFLDNERVISGQLVEPSDKMCSSTPKGSDADKTHDNSIIEFNVSERKGSDCGSGLTLTKSEQIFPNETLSPFESPTKSHPTDTYDDNSSVVLGPFENCLNETHKDVKITEIELPKEELLAFSSNFSEINLETPSPLRDVNFLKEVPDILDDIQYDVTSSNSYDKKEPQTDNSDGTDGSGTAKHVSPSTPPNSPGIFLASTSQQAYLVDVDLEDPNDVPKTPQVDDSGPSSLLKEIDLNQIEMTTKLAMAENENNMNIEYSGPLTVEGIVLDEEVIFRESDAIPEAILAGNGGSLEDMREAVTMDDACMQALRNELEIKLPLAQVASITPAMDSEPEWCPLPPPPELILGYTCGALSPIQEETRNQLTAYENNVWDASMRTESSESYPEPCNNSTDEITDLGTTASPRHDTYTVHSRDSAQQTYTLQKDPTSKELTMSMDSLNVSPHKQPTADLLSPDDKTYTKNEDDKVSNCERLSQVSPCLLSPTTETSVPVSDNVDNVTGTSRTTVPTDAKHAKPSECLSKATSIDSWCSNDTLYNVEENFDDLAMDSVDINQEDKSESSDTLTHHDDDKEHSNCSTYIIHDSKSEPCETFSPDSITANENYTYTKVKTEAATEAKSDINDSTKNTQTKDLAYGTLPSYSNCTTEVLSSAMEEPWNFAQPELVRKSPMNDEIGMTPPRFIEDNEKQDFNSPVPNEHSAKSMDNVEISCLNDGMNQSKTPTSEGHNSLPNIDVSPQYNYNRNLGPSVTSTPIVVIEQSELINDSPFCEIPDNINCPNFQSFLQSAEIRPQDISPNGDISNNQETDLLLEGESKMISKNSNRDSPLFVTRDSQEDRTPNYSVFEISAVTKPQEYKSSQSIESINSADFRQFENSVKNRPQDLSSIIDASSMLLRSERMSSEALMGYMTNFDTQNSRNFSLNQPEDRVPPIEAENSRTIESYLGINRNSFNLIVTDLDVEDENEQPHSIIITDSTAHTIPAEINLPIQVYNAQDLSASNNKDTSIENNDKSKESVKSNDSYTILYETYNSHPNRSQSLKEETNEDKSFEVHDTNVTEDTKHATEDADKESSQVIDNVVETERNHNPNRVVSIEEKEIKCNGNSEHDTVKPVEETETNDTLQHEGNEGFNEVHTPTEIQDVKDTESKMNGIVEDKIASEDFLQNEKKFCKLISYLPLISDIRFTGPTSEIMSTSFTQKSPTEPNSPECEKDKKPEVVADLVKEWDSDSESQSSNSSSGEFIWKDGGGRETSLVSTTHFDHHGNTTNASQQEDKGQGSASEGSGDSGSGSEGDEVEFVPSSWDCRAEPSKSSLRSLEATPDSKKRVVFKRQKYHCVYEYPREVVDVEHSPTAYMPDFSTYCEWDPSSAEEAELGYGQLYGSPLDLYPLRAGIAFGAGDYDEDFFISSSARPFESLGMLSTSSQFFPGMHLKPSVLERDLDDSDQYPIPSSLPTTLSKAPSLDFTTPDSGVEDITPVSTSTEEDLKKLPEDTWKPTDSGSSSESVSPCSPGGEALGGLRHTRDKLKLDLPPSPHIPSPRHNRVFNFVLDKPKRKIPDEKPAEETTLLVMTDETPIITTTLALPKEEDVDIPEPTFSTFGKGQKDLCDSESDQKIILSDEVKSESKPESPKTESPKAESPVKGEGTVLDSGDEDSGIESSSKATLERKTPNIS